MAFPSPFDKAEDRSNAAGAQQSPDQRHLSDLHRQRSVIVVLNDDRDRVSWSRIDNSAVNLAREVIAAGPDAQVAMEACWGWSWAADVIAECEAQLHRTGSSRCAADPPNLGTGHQAAIGPLDVAGEKVLHVLTQSIIGDELGNLRADRSSLGMLSPIEYELRHADNLARHQAR